MFCPTSRRVKGCMFQPHAEPAKYRAFKSVLVEYDSGLDARFTLHYHVSKHLFSSFFYFCLYSALENCTVEAKWSNSLY